MRVVFLLCFLFLISCSPSTPKDILPPSKMQSVMWDVLQADEMSNFYAEKDSSFNNISRYIDNYQNVFSVHRVTKDDFKRSLEYYEGHPEKFKPILDSLYTKGERLQKGDTLKKTSPKHIIDSANKRIIDTAKFL